MLVPFWQVSNGSNQCPIRGLSKEIFTYIYTYFMAIGNYLLINLQFFTPSEKHILFLWI